MKEWVNSKNSQKRKKKLSSLIVPICRYLNNVRKEFDLLENFYIKNLQDHLYQTLDGCVVGDTPKTEIIRTYAEIFNASYLVLVKNFWKDCYSDLDVPILLILLASSTVKTC